MATERTRRGEFSQSVTDHILGDIDRHVATAIMHGNGMPHHLGEMTLARLQVRTTFFSPR